MALRIVANICAETRVECAKERCEKKLTELSKYFHNNDPRDESNFVNFLSHFPFNFNFFFSPHFPFILSREAIKLDSPREPLGKLNWVRVSPRVFQAPEHLAYSYRLW